MKKIFIIVFSLLIMITSSCMRNKEHIKSTEGHFLRVTCDTLVIHGNKHEFLMNPGYATQIFIHSPECWCLKTKNSSNINNDLDDNYVEEESID